MSKILAAALAAMMFPAPVPVFGQAQNEGTVVEEAVRRQEAAKILKIKLAEAKSAERKGQVAEASRLYQEGVVQLNKLGAQTAGIEKERTELLQGFSAVCLTLSKSEEKRGNLLAARDQLNRALAIDSRNPAVLEQKRRIDQLIESSKGLVPSEEILARAPKITEEKVEMSTAVQNAKWLLEAGKIDEAEAILVKALQSDPSNPAANHYLTLLKQTRYDQASRKRDQMAQKSIIEIENTWTPRKKGDNLPVPNPMARTNLVYTSEGRQKIMQKLEKIQLDEVSYDGLPLSTVLTALREESAKRDPDREGVNFLLRSQPDSVVLPPPVPVGGGAQPAQPPPAAFGDPSANGPLPSVDVNSISIRITPSLRKLSLKQVLDAIVQVSDQPITYRIDDYAVVFQPKPPAAQQLITRQFKVDPNTFVQGLQGVFGVSLTSLAGSQANGGGGQGGGGGGGGGNQQDSISFIIPSITPSGIISSGGGGGGGGGLGGGGGGGGFGGGGGGGGLGGGGQGNANNPGVGQTPIAYVTSQLSTRDMNDMARLYFEAAGVDLQPPKNIFFNDRAGILVVRAAAQDLETIQTAIEVLNAAPPQITIEAKFAEFNQTDNKQLGFDWYLGNTLAAGGDIGLSGGTAPSYINTPTSTANPVPAFPTPAVPIAGSATDGLLTSGLRSSAPSVFTLTGILTDPQFRAVIKALEQREGADVLTAPKVTTLSGRQAKIAVNDLVTYVSGLQTQGGGGGGGAVVGGIGTAQGGQNGQITPTTATFPVGPTLDVVPYVSADGFSVQMTIIPTVNEFLGYDTSNFNAILQLGVGNTIGNALVAPTPLPRFRVRYVTTSCVVWDGQTVVLGGLISDSIQKIKDKVPVLGDLPLFGRFFRSESNTTNKKNLYIFVTPTIIDPAGNRVHSDEDLPFAKHTTTSSVK